MAELRERLNSSSYGGVLIIFAKLIKLDEQKKKSKNLIVDGFCFSILSLKDFVLYSLFTQKTKGSTFRY